MNRREFALGSATAMLATSGWPGPLRAATARIRFGCAAITWGGHDDEAIAEIGALDYRGIQLRANAVTTWGDRPERLRELLHQHRLTFVALSSGTVGLEPAKADATRDLHVANARFLKAAGGKYLQVIDERPQGRRPGVDDFRRMGRLLTEIGRRCADLDIQVGYHNHMGALGQSPDEVARVLDATDPRYVRLELDIAHYAQAGGDPARAIREHADRLLFLHLKDVQSPVPGGNASSYRFVPLGHGKVDLKAVFGALEQVSFNGWGVVELDGVTGLNITPREGNAQSAAYLRSLHYSVAELPAGEGN